MIDAMRHPPLPTAWISSALTDAVFCAVADTHYPTEEAVVKWTYDRVVGLARVPMYSALAKLAGLERFLKTVARVHALFMRGTDFEGRHPRRFGHRAARAPAESAWAPESPFE
jgi:hypothetical protein